MPFPYAELHWLHIMVVESLCVIIDFLVLAFLFIKVILHNPPLLRLFLLKLMGTYRNSVIRFIISWIRRIAPEFCSMSPN